MYAVLGTLPQSVADEVLTMAPVDPEEMRRMDERDERREKEMLAKAVAETHEEDGTELQAALRASMADELNDPSSALAKARLSFVCGKRA